jgi:hypothetical protein
MVVIEVNEYHPGCMLCGGVVPDNPLLQKRLALFAMHASRASSNKKDQRSCHCLIHDALHRG